MNSKGLPLSKTASLAPDGTLRIVPSAQLSNGRFRVVAAATVTDLARVISALTTSEALAHGVPKTGAQSGTIVAGAKRQANPDAITRSLEFFEWGPGPGWMMGDLDLKDLPPEIADDLDLSSVAAIREILIGAVPELRSVSMLGLPSASAMIRRVSDGELLRGLTGVRFYVPVEHAGEIPEIGKLLFNRLVLAGLGYAFISRSGRVVHRTLIDSAVWSAERLDFAGGADCREGVEQKRGEPLIWNEGNKAWFSLEPLTAQEEQELASITAEIVAGAAEKAAAVRVAYLAERKAAGHPIVATEGEGGFTYLAPDHAIELADGAWITVADILANPGKYHGQNCSDPIEHDYAPRSNHVAKIFAAGQRCGPVIHSMAHGGLTFLLDRGGPVPDAADDFQALPTEPVPAGAPFLSEDDELAALTGDAEGTFFETLSSIPDGGHLTRWNEVQEAAARPHHHSAFLAMVVLPLAEAASRSGEGAFNLTFKHKLASNQVWRGLPASDKRLLIRAVRMLLKKGASEVRAPRLVGEPQPIEWLVDGAIPAGSVSAFVGPANQGKTFGASHLACIVGSPKESNLTFDGRAVEKHGPVFYFASEDAQGLARRRKAWADANGVEPEVYIFDDVPLLSGPLNDLVRVLRSAAERTSSMPALIVMDHFSDTVIGDDNSAELVAPAMRRARVAARMFGATLVILHHSNKADPKDARGSSAFGNAVDVTLAVIAEGRDIVLSWVKARSTAKGSNFTFHLRNGVLYNGRSAQGGESGALSEGETLARAAGRALHYIETPATLADWNASIKAAAPSCFGEKSAPSYQRTKLARARRAALDRSWVQGEKNKYIAGPVAVPDEAMELGNLSDLSPLAPSEDLI